MKKGKRRTPTKKFVSTTSARRRKRPLRTNRNVPTQAPAPPPLRTAVLAAEPASPRVLLVLDQLNVGGTETHALALARELRRQGAHVALAAKRGRLLDAYLGLGAPYYEIDFVRDDYRADKANEGLHRDVLTSIIAAERIDVVHAHQFPSGHAAYKAARQMGVPFVFTMHGTYFESEALSAWAPSTSFIAVSPPVQRTLRARGIASELIPNGIDSSSSYDRAGDVPVSYRAYVRRKLGLGPDTKAILYASRLAWEKADVCEEVLRAAAALRAEGRRDVRFLVAGGGRRAEGIRATIQKLNETAGEPFVQYCGEVTDLDAYIVACDGVIGTGRIALEAMSRGRLLLAYGSRGCLGLLRPERHNAAWTTWFGDHDAASGAASLVDEIRALVDLPAAEREALARANLEQTRSRYAIRDTAANAAALYRRAANLSWEEFA